MAEIVFWRKNFDRPEWVVVEGVALNSILIGFRHMQIGLKMH
jgi:hypothetical protein